METRVYRVTGMTCGHCEAAVREEVAQVAGVDDVQVSAQSGSLTVTGVGLSGDEAVIAAVAEAGYSATLA